MKIFLNKCCEVIDDVHIVTRITMVMTVCGAGILGWSIFW